MDESEAKTKLTASENLPKPLNEVHLDLRYGWGKFRPRFLQFVNGPNCFTLFLAIFSMTQGDLEIRIQYLFSSTLSRSLSFINGA